jgi:virginiamycin A acetyltransferase
VSLGNVSVMGGVRICAHTYVNDGSIIHSETYIGRYCSIGNRVSIGTGHHDMNLLSTSSWFESDAPPSYRSVGGDGIVRVRILNDVWVGDGAIIMGGVLVGNGAVIGAGSVVTKDVPDYAVVVGVPAKVIRYRFPLEISQRLLALRWWEFDDRVLKQHRLKDIEASLQFLKQLPDSSRVDELLTVI